VELTHASEAMAKGQYDHNIVAHGNDEVARLAKSFNEMAHQVGQTHQTLREFLANASHELKTPLTSIQGFSQAMVDGAITEPADYAHAASIVYAESERMRKLVDDLLLLSRMETGQVSMEQRVLDIKALIATCLERFQWRAEQKNTELKLSAEGVVPGVLGDSSRLEQVVGNLLDNAIRYSADGGVVTVKVESVRTEAPAIEGEPQEQMLEPAAGMRDWVRITVHNTGSWVREEELARLFERFYRGNRHTERQSDGAGLGLAIVREIVTSHGGWVVARSDSESGTEFEVNLPAEEVKPEKHSSSGKRKTGKLNSFVNLSSHGDNGKA
jgi:signal transduction histidine kinase